jgi:endonuclease/exonuclease/phosphatase family metal-dependent hydrolase
VWYDIAVKKPLKIGLWNMGYMTGIRGGSDYARHASRFLRTPRRARTEVLRSFKRLVAEEKPDVIFLMEIRDLPELRKIAKDYDLIRIDSKYLGHGFMGRMPGIRKNANGFFARKHCPHAVRAMRNGSKKLLYTLDVAKNTSLVLGHFALSKKKRAKQFAELSKIEKDKKIIVAGDFNIFGGTKELKPLLKKRNLHIANTDVDMTYPTKKPRHALDLVLAPKEFACDVRVRNDIVSSDHLPVVCSVAMQ